MFCTVYTICTYIKIPQMGANQSIGVFVGTKLFRWRINRRRGKISVPTRKGTDMGNEDFILELDDDILDLVAGGLTSDNIDAFAGALADKVRIVALRPEQVTPYVEGTYDALKKRLQFSDLGIDKDQLTLSVRKLL